MLQSMASNPMMQQMAQQNPMLAQALQNPALLAQSVQALQQNPAMMQQLNQMMSDPNAMARMQQMMAGGGMGGMGGLGGFGGSPFGAAAPAPAAASNPFAAGTTGANPFASAPSASAPAAAAPTPAPASTPAAAAAAASTPAPTAASSSAPASSTEDATDTYEEDEIADAIARSPTPLDPKPSFQAAMPSEQQPPAAPTGADSKLVVSSVPSNSSSGDGVHSFAPLPFDESLVAALGSGIKSSDRHLQSASSAGMAAAGLDASNSNKSAADFFLDQIAAVVADEKKLSDNIMDLIPPVEAPRSHPGVGSSAMSAGLLTLPLQPPPGLMMRALSPPTSLLPDFAEPGPLSLDLAAVSSTALQMPAAIASMAASMTTVTTAVKRDLPTVKPAVTGAAIASLRRKAVTETTSAPAVAAKKRKTEALTDIKPEAAVKTAPSAATSVLQQQQARQHLHTSTSNAMSASAAAVAAAAREKVMKEPQSGDLYECVITKRNGGLGLTLACVDDHVQITGLAPDTPAANSGICVGDTLVAVSGLPVRGLQFSTVIGRLKSTSRNSVVLKLRRNPSSDSGNSANVLSSKTMALETRLGGVSTGLNGSGSLGSSLNGQHNGSAATGGLDELHRAHHQGATGSLTHATGLYHGHQLQTQLKSEPMNSTYFPTDASILTMGAPASGPGSLAATAVASLSSSSTAAELGWRVGLEEKERYYAECRALRHELGRAMVARRAQKRDAAVCTTQLQAVVDKFQRELQSLLPSAASAVAAAASSSSTVEKEMATLRQKLLEANHALAKQQTEMLALQEREARHAVPEAQRVKWQLVSRMRKSVLQVDCKAAVKAASMPAVKKLGVPSPPLAFEERMDGVRPSAFALLVGQSSRKPRTATVELDLDAKTCTELLGWNLREVVAQAGATYSVSVAEAVHVKYMRGEEALAVSWTLSVQEVSRK
ncbi:hypothetical protein BBJ28_00012302 [Nothophytophthora sp. Chile5]|nr:hypothetical protein BBJ28_00012302 [Nothophytophthora sp. Chile5]